jgi:hypothetical protein
VLVHLGAHKTASTHFNRLLRKNGTLTSQFSVAVPRKDEIRSLVTRRLSGGNLKETGPMRAEVVGVLAQGARTLFLSDENILGTPNRLVQNGVMYPSAGKRVRAALRLLGDGPVELMLAVREPGSFAVSSWGEAMRSWGYLDFRAYIGADPIPSLRWSQLVRRILAARSGIRLTVWTFENYREKTPELVADVLGLESLEGHDLLDIDSVVRPGLSQRAVDEIRVICEGSVDSPSQDTFEEIVKTFPKSDAFPAPRPWSEEELKALSEQYRRDVRRLSQFDGVRFLG